MNTKLLIHTLRHLRLRQVCYQVRYRLLKPKFVAHRVTNAVVRCNVTKGVDRYLCCEGEKLNFLNITDDFKGWPDTSKGMLWAYNLNYMDWLNQPNMPYEIGARWIDDFIHNLPFNSVGQDPYPIALRAINWIKFITKYWDDIPAEKRTEWCNSLYSQYQLLIKKLEYHLLANHLLEDVYSLFIGAIFFRNEKIYKLSTKLLKRELNEQILKDGAHYEQSVMYHIILLERLLDCYNFSFNNICFVAQDRINDFLYQKAKLMLGHLESIKYIDYSFPLFNDAAIGIAPSISDVFNYAKRLDIEWDSINLLDSGYRRMQNNCFEATIDVGNIMASYQPGHSHADTFNYELRINGMPFVVDTGISTYNKTKRRQYERSSAAHNVVVIDNLNSSEVWGGFRVGRRAKVKLIKDSRDNIIAIHNGYSKYGDIERSFEIREYEFIIKDLVKYKTEAISYIHFAPNVIVDIVNGNLMTNILNINIDGANKIEIVENTISKEYNKFEPIKVAKIYFNSNLKLTFVKI
ncbi:MAG: alginate lyase family protein [Bacteroidales bacterium]|nr:alginate lyase family protein [Bacteroidales bacterium]